MINQTRDYLFTSERLGFRCWTDEDIPLMTAISADPEVMRFFPITYSLEHITKFIRDMQAHQKAHGFCYYAVDILESHSFIGFIGIKWTKLAMEPSSFVDIGWRLAKHYWGHGYATEGAQRCLDYAIRDLNLSIIYAMAPVINEPSIAVMRKCGMQFLKEFEHPLLLDNARLKQGVLYVKTGEL